jgi:hypothetical protein
MLEEKKHSKRTVKALWTGGRWTSDSNLNIKRKPAEPDGERISEMIWSPNDHQVNNSLGF